MIVNRYRTAGFAAMLLSAALLVFPSPGASQAGPVARAMELNAAFQQIASKVTPAVVSISSSRPRRSGASAERDRVVNMGSGVIVSADGYLLTNNHVISGASDIRIMLLDGRTYEAEVMGTDHTTDLAVLRLQDLEPGTELPTIEFGDSDSCSIGAWVLAVGNPMELGISVTAGIISAKARKIDILSEDPLNIRGNVDQSIESFIQTDAVINPGNSGGALVSLHGELIGINTAIASRTGLYQGYGFAIPINLARRVMEDLIAYGRVIRPVLGVVIQGLDPVRARALGLESPQGVLIEDFSPRSGSPAERGGLRRGDVIVEVESRRIRFTHQLQETIAKFRPGDRVRLTVVRDGERVGREVTLGSKEIDSASPAAGRASEAKAASRRTSNLGLQLREITNRDMDLLDMDTRRGVIVERVNEGGAAERSGVRSGDVLLSVERRPVNSVRQVRDILDDTSSGSAVLLMVLRDGNTHFIGLEIP